MKNTIQNASKEFLLEFFNSSKISDNGGVLLIEDVPAKFEEFIGKKAPYKFVFDINIHNKTPDSELIMQGSYFLVAIKDYLRDKGQTSLLKINAESMPRNLRSKSGLMCEFLFLSTYQYLNEKKQTMNKILVRGNEVLDVDLSKIKTQPGNQNEVASTDILDPYNLAKKNLDEKVRKEIKPIKLILKEKLEKELFRVKHHYFKQIKEKDEELETCANKIKMLQGKLKHTSYSRDINILERMIAESKERLEMLKKRSYRERLKIEENFHINDEIEKHVLSIKNVLINATIYYW